MPFPPAKARETTTSARPAPGRANLFMDFVIGLAPLQLSVEGFEEGSFAFPRLRDYLLPTLQARADKCVSRDRAGNPFPSKKAGFCRVQARRCARRLSASRAHPWTEHRYTHPERERGA